jgi:integrase
MANAPTPAWPEAIDQFVAYLEEEERSDHTIRNYQDDLSAFGSWYRGQYEAEPDLPSLGKRDIVDWKKSVEAAGGRNGASAALATVNRKLAAIRSFLRWAQDQELAPQFDPPKPQKRQSKPEPRWLEKSEERALVATVEASQSDRDAAILWLGLHGGLRVSEMKGLDCSDARISDRKGELLIRKGKGAKQRTIKLSKTLRNALVALIGHRRDGTPILKNMAGKRITVRGLQDIAERYGRQTRVGKRVGLDDFSIHVLRHTCARRMLEKGVPITDVAEHLGHSDTKTTMGYLTPKDRDLVKAVESLDEN